MIPFKKILITLLIILFLGLHFPPTLKSKEIQLIAQNTLTKGITEHIPEVFVTQEEKIPIEVIKKKRKKWPWIVGGAILAGIYFSIPKGKDDDDDAEVTVEW